MMRLRTLSILLMIGFAAPSVAQVSVSVGVPGLSIGVNLGGYPEFERVTGYPVYYAPRVDSNMFFYDGAYWVYAQDDWYVSSWYDGPWDRVAPYDVPAFVLRVPMRYYRRPPAYFRGWQPAAAPHWGEHWGREWEQRRSGWDRWDRRSAPPPAPLPTYQRQYSGIRYPSAEQQRSVREQHYRYQPREGAVRERYGQPTRRDLPQPLAPRPGTVHREPQRSEQPRQSSQPQPAPRNTRGPDRVPSADRPTPRNQGPAGGQRRADPQRATPPSEQRQQHTAPNDNRGSRGGGKERKNEDKERGQDK
jgi:hypothetical protein